MTKSLQLLKELLEEDKLDIKEVMEVLGYEIVEHEMKDVYGKNDNNDDIFLTKQIGYDEVITIKKEYR